MLAVNAPQRPVLHAEQSLVAAILDGVYPPDSALPGERDLATSLGVTRPTLREAMQRLARDGWLTIRQGKPTRVNDFWREGGLNVLSTLVHCQRLPPNFVLHLLEVRRALTPAYTEAAVRHAAPRVVEILVEASDLDDSAEAFAAYDWQLHRVLTIASGNPVYTLILNGFAGFYEEMAQRYFAHSEARQLSRFFYTSLREAAHAGDTVAAAQISRTVMQESITLWRQAEQEHSRDEDKTL
jgi:GntR family negative regulator for fad regulon and positive regulator of fabA